MIEYFVIGILALLVGWIVGAKIFKRRWNAEREDWRKWQDAKLAEIKGYQNKYRFRNETVDGQLVRFATFDGGKKWYQIQEDETGLQIMLSPDEAAKPIIVQALIQQSHIDAAVRRGLPLFG